MKTGTVVLIGIGAASLYVLTQGQQAKAEGGGQGILPGLQLPSMPSQLPSMPEIALTMPEFSFAMPDLSFAMPESLTPQALPDVGQSINDALTGFLGTLNLSGGGNLPWNIPESPINLPTIPGLEEGGFFKNLSDTWANLWGTGSNVAKAATDVTATVEVTTGFVEAATEKLSEVTGAIAGGAKIAAARPDPWQWVLDPFGALGRTITDQFFGKSEPVITPEREAQIAVYVAEAEAMYPERGTPEHAAWLEEETKQLGEALHRAGLIGEEDI